MSLVKYQAKRKFAKTPEPKGRIKKSIQQRFVIQKHQASHLHYDFRLEMFGVLKSWAVPKNLPLKKGIKHLAVQTEDHPVDYLDFQGVIPKGNYGAGAVKTWDKGKYKLITEITKKSLPKSFKFILHGKKVKGEYSMVRFQKKNWLIFKV